MHITDNSRRPRAATVMAAGALVISLGAVFFALSQPAGAAYRVGLNPAKTEEVVSDISVIHEVGPEITVAPGS